MTWSRLVLVVAVWWSFSSCDGNTEIDVRLEGSGVGRVTSKTIIGPSWDKVAIDCPGDCAEHSNWKSKYVVTATPAAGSRFAGWDDDGDGECRSLGPCEVFTGTKDTYVLIARFELESTVDLTVSRTGSGDGRVRSLETSTIDCGTTCSGAFTVGTTVTLEAVAATGSKFVGWSGACSGSSATCVVSMDGAKSVSAAFAPADLELSVGTLGLGSGTVTSSPSGIACGSSCSAGFAPGTTVTLSAVADTNSTFLGWSDGCSGTGACTVTLSTAVNVNARFERQQRTLTITRAGTGGGTVSSFPAGVDCGSTCAADFVSGSIVNLTATADATSTFAGWSGGGCSGTGPCSVTLADAVTVTATFTRHRYALSVSLAGTGAGRVTSSPTAIDCGSSCSADFDSGTTVTLTAAPDAGSTFAGWSGACSGTGSCSVTVTAITSVSATFSRNVYELTVSRLGTGQGTITSSPAGLACGTSCTAPFASGTAVTLTATPDATSTFTGWSGACSGTAACVVTVSAATSVSATFTRNRYALHVAKSGSGNGAVTSAPAGIDCGTSCTTDFDAGTVVTLTATPDGASSFAGWSGACTGSGACVVTMSAAANVTATFSATPFALTVIRAGTGGGTVSSSPAGIACGTTCSSTFPASTVVTLTAAADATSTFTGWSGAGCSGTGSCTVTISAALTVTATFTRRQYALTVSRAGLGTGTVTSSPAGIGCGSSCSASFDAGSTVTLTAVASSGSTFSGWSGGGCSGTGPCVVTLLAATTVTATFALNSYTLAVTKFGTGGGAVTSFPAGITCGPTCAATFAHGTAVTLTASADATSDFSGWSGACVGTAPCVVTLTAASSVSATFTRRRYALTVAKSGAGGGTVTSSPSGISCGATCSVTFDAGSTVTLTAAADATSRFAGWSGGGCSGTETCVVSLTAATTVTATFLPTEVLSASTTGAGTITSEPVGLDCGATCVARFVTGTVVSLTATPSAGNTFVGWTGACSGTGACVVTLDSAKSVGALFMPITWALHVTKIGLGRVTSNPAGIDCGGFCSFSFTPQTVVLTANPDVGFSFVGWSGDCSGTGTCTLSMSA
ncbi:MAG: hypothetical protein JNM17_36805, partial [Archangium sp.]|nr:hypothetical protein [Archangium sp.]